MPTYNRYPIAFDHGEGVWLYDTDGNKYLDAISGIAVCPLGHNHLAFTQALMEQSKENGQLKAENDKIE